MVTGIIFIIKELVSCLFLSFPSDISFASNVVYPETLLQHTEGVRQRVRKCTVTKT